MSATNLEQLRSTFKSLKTLDEMKRFITNLDEKAKGKGKEYKHLLHECIQSYNRAALKSGAAVKWLYWADVSKKAYNDGMGRHADCESRLSFFMRNSSSKTGDILNFMETENPPSYNFAYALDGLTKPNAAEPPDFHARLLKSAAEKDYMPAQYLLGNCFANGLGVPKDIGKAIFWWDKAAKKHLFEANEALLSN
jgi:TPR repeat protein